MDRTRLLHQYAEKIGIDIPHQDGEKIKESYGRLLFIEIVRDFQKGALSADDLSSLCEAVYLKFEGTDLFELLLNGAEIEWYIRWNPEVGATFIRDLIIEFGAEWVDPEK